MSLKITARRIKFWWNLSFAYTLRYKLQLSIFILITAITVFLSFKIWPIINQGNTVNIGYVGVYSLETIPTQILSLATQSLVTKDGRGRPIPQLAEHWTVSDDGKTYVVFLKENLRWHDSTSVDAKDISVAIKGVKITALNNKVIEFKLESPISSFPLALDRPVFKARTFYGTGQFRIVDIDQKDNIVKKITLVGKDPQLPRVNIKFYQTEGQAIHALKIGEIKNANITKAGNFSDWKTLEVERQLDTTEVIAIFFNNQDPQLASKELRQALSHAVNREEFDGIPGTSPIAPSSWAYNENVKRYDYNTSKAKELLSKSQVEKPKIKLAYTSELQEIAKKIKEDWQAVGVETELVEEKNVPKDFQALLALDKLNPDPDQYAMWHSTQHSTNITKYKDVKIDKLLEDARSIKEEEERKALYLDFQKFLMEDAPAIFLYHPYRYQITYKNTKSKIAKLAI